MTNVSIGDPGTVNIFRNMLGLAEARWEEKKGEEEQQRRLEEFPAIDSKQRTPNGCEIVFGEEQ